MLHDPTLNSAARRRRRSQRNERGGLNAEHGERSGHPYPRIGGRFLHGSQAVESAVSELRNEVETFLRKVV
jgi:hypothetical protein